MLWITIPHKTRNANIGLPAIALKNETDDVPTVFPRRPSRLCGVRLLGKFSERRRDATASEGSGWNGIVDPIQLESVR